MIANVSNELEMVERHFTILKQVFESEPIGIVALADKTGFPRHKVRYSLRVLENSDLVEPTDQGAISTDDAVAFVESSPDRIDVLISKLEGLKTETGAVEA